jgi:hypothetical protein
VPCQYYTPAEEARLAQQELHKLTRMLCAAMEHIEAKGLGLLANIELCDWWEEHKRNDAEEAAAQERKKHLKKVIKKAYDKLTPEEREALGLS